MAVIATVTKVQGQVFAVDAKGVRRALKQGDQIQEGETVITAAGATVVLQSVAGNTITIVEGQTVVVDASVAGGPGAPDRTGSGLAGPAPKVVPTDPNRLIEDEATAAGLAGGDGGGNSFVQLIRLAESASSSNAYTFNSNTFGGPLGSVSAPIGDPAITTAPTQLTAANDANGINEGAANVAVPVTSGVIANDTAASAGAILTITAVRTGTEAAGAGTPGAVGSALAGTFGTLTLNANGTYTYVLNNNSETNSGALVQALAPGDSLTDVFTYTVSDGSVSDRAELVITISGTNDLPIARGDANTIAEDAAVLTLSGSLLTNDTPGDGTLAQNVFAVSGSATGTHGSLAVEANGNYVYTLNNASAAVQSLGAGVTATDTLTYSLIDKNGDASLANLVVTVTGVNDAPGAVADANAGDAVIESGVNPGNTAVPGDAIAAGNVLGNDTDVDTGDTKTVSAVNGVAGNVGAAVVGTYGSVTIGADGAYTYTLNNDDADTNVLLQGASVTDVFQYTMRDGSGAVSSAALTITITGTNDLPTAVADTNAGDAVTEMGRNPGGNTAFAGDPTATGNVLGNDTDIDAGDTKTVSAVNGVVANVGAALAGTYGSVTIGTDGAYTYTLNNADGSAADQLGQGASASDVFTYTLRDASGANAAATLTVNITGTNDRPDINGFSGLGVRERFDGAADENTVTHTIGDVITFSDRDTGDTHSATFSPQGEGYRGTFALAEVDQGADTVRWSFSVPDSQLDSMREGQTIEQRYDVTIADANRATRTATIVVSVVGTNDNPIAVADTNSTDAVTEMGVNPGNTPVPGDATASGNVLSNDTDVDAGDTRFVTAVNTNIDAVGIAVAGQYGAVTISRDGSYTYTLDNTNAITNALAQGASVNEVFNYTMSDGAGSPANSTLTITITGTNDAPTLVADTNAGDAVLEAGSNPGFTEVPTFPGDPTAAGNVRANDSDPDTGDTRTVSAVNGVAGNVGAAVTGTYGAVTLAANGDYTYTLNNEDTDTNALAKDATATDVFTYTARDANGATANSTLTITITGSNDRPTAVADTNASDAVIEQGVNPANTAVPGDPTTTGNVLANDTDPDTGDTKAVSAVNGAGANVGAAVTGTYGAVVIGATGAYTYTLNNADTDTNNLAQGASVTDVFQYTMRDADGAISNASLSITITGTNDVPVANADTHWLIGTSGGGDTAATGNVITGGGHGTAPDGATYSDVADADPESAAGLTTTDATMTGTYGTLVLQSSGAYTYTRTSDIPINYDDAESLDEVFNYSVIDPQGATLNVSTLTVKLFGLNDAPIANDDTNFVNQSPSPSGTGGTFPPVQTVEGNAVTGIQNGTLDDKAVDTDADIGGPLPEETLEVTAIRTGTELGAGTDGTPDGTTVLQGSFGTLTISRSGDYVYNYTGGGSGGSSTDTFTYTVSDGPQTDTGTLTIRIENPAPGPT